MRFEKENKKQIRCLKIIFCRTAFKNVLYTISKNQRNHRFTRNPGHDSNELRRHINIYPGFLPPYYTVAFSGRFVFATFIPLFHREMSIHSGRSRLTRAQSLRTDITYRFIVYFPSKPRYSRSSHLNHISHAYLLHMDCMQIRI